MKPILESPSKSDVGAFVLGVFITLSPMLLIVETKFWLQTAGFYLTCSAVNFLIASRVTRWSLTGWFVLINALGTAVIGCLVSALVTKNLTAMAGILVLGPIVSALSTTGGLLLALLGRKLERA